MSGNYCALKMFNTLILLSRELWLMIDSVMPSCCSRMVAPVDGGVSDMLYSRHYSRHRHYDYLAYDSGIT